MRGHANDHEDSEDRRVDFLMRVFETKDKSGRSIYMTRERWTHVLQHPEMMNQANNIMDALSQPDKVTRVFYDAAVRFYYKFNKERKKYLFVSVKYLNGEGFIITSFYTDKIK